MGYYITVTSSDVMIPAEHEERALLKLKLLNHREDLKGGGSWGGAGKGKTESWFAWMPNDYDKTVKSTAEIFKLLGFEVEVNEEGTYINYYDSKIGDEQHFFDAVAEFVPDGRVISFQGEDGALFRFVFEQGKMTTEQGRMVEDWDG